MADNKKLPYVSVARVFSMLMILGCHIIKYYTFIPGHDFLGQVLNVGVEVFLVISGYLYGAKRIDKAGRWLFARARRVWLPVLLFVVVDLACLSLISHISAPAATVAVYACNLQGLSFIWYKFASILSIDNVQNITHLWFTTVIMLCYILVPLCQRIKGKNGGVAKWLNGNCSLFSFTGISVILIAIAELVFAIAQVSLGYFVIFIIGYALRSEIEKHEQVSGKYLIVFTIFTGGLQIGRVLLRGVIDGTQTYNAYVGLSHNVLGLYIFVMIIAIYRKWPNAMSKIAMSKVVSAIDGLSFYIYIVHGLFFREPWNVYIGNSLPIATLEFFVFSIIGACILKWITEFTDKGIEKLTIQKGRA